MNLDEIRKIFFERLANIQLYQRAANEVAKKELEFIIEYAEKLKNNPSLENWSSSTHIMFFIDPHTGNPELYKFCECSVKDRTTQVILQKNKQYCWLLAEAYEEFEDFLESIYAYIGKHDYKLWPKADLDNLSPSDLHNKNFEWYLEKSRAKKSRDILNRLRFLYPNIITIEANNKLNVNLKVAMELIAHLRHIIVHNSGKVKNRNDFFKNILEKSGVWNNGKYDSHYKVFVEKFFGTGDFENVIALLEIGINRQPITICYDRFGELIRYLAGFTFHIYQCISSVK